MSWDLVLKFIVLMVVVCGVLIFFMKKIFFDTTEGAKNRLERETDAVRQKQKELNEKIKQANEELEKRRAEADQLVLKMKEDASEEAKAEREKIVKKAREEADEIITKAQKTREDMRKALEREMHLKTVDFTSLLLAQVLQDRGIEALHADLTLRFIEELKDVDMEMITEDIQEAEVFSALPLNEKLRNLLSDVLKEKLGRTIALKPTVDPKLIAGVMLRFGTLSLNGSLAFMLTEEGATLKDKIEKGIVEIGS